jgi:hypothetical protein
MNTRRELGLHAQTLGKSLSRGAQANACGATQVLGRVSQAVSPGSFCLRYLIVVPRSLPAATLAVRRKYLIVAPRPLPAALLAVRRTNLVVMSRPVPKPLPATTRRFRIKTKKNCR